MQMIMIQRTRRNRYAHEVASDKDKNVPVAKAVVFGVTDAGDDPAVTAGEDDDEAILKAGENENDVLRDDIVNAADADREAVPKAVVVSGVGEESEAIT